MTTTTQPKISDPKQLRRVCFSFAAYAKTVIEHLRSCRIAVAAGLSDSEFSAIESSYGFVFPPDLRSILREGLPIGTGFPNWRSSSPQQLQILLKIPVSGLLNEVSKGSFWSETWGLKPENTNESLTVARGILEKSPVLVPIFRNFYIPSTPNLAGNPVLFVRGGDVRCSGFDLADFFQREEFYSGKDRGSLLLWRAPAPAWAAKSARKVEVWTDLVEGVDADTWRGKGWTRGGGLEGWLKEMGWRLREGGWGEEEVREMLMGTDGGDDGRLGDRMVLRDRQSVMWHMRLLALTLLRAGWRNEDVVDSMGWAHADEPRKGVVTWQVDPIRKDISMEL